MSRYDFPVVDEARGWVDRLGGPDAQTLSADDTERMVRRLLGAIYELRERCLRLEGVIVKGSPRPEETGEKTCPSSTT